MSDYTTDTLPDWVKVGQPVASIHSGWNSHIDYEGTITKIGKRDIVVAHNLNPDLTRKYRVRDLRRQGEDYGNQLADPNGPEVTDVRAEEADRARMRAARDAVDHWKHDRDDDVRTRAVIVAFTALLSESAPQEDQ
jgi:hypothetical protein